MDFGKGLGSSLQRPLMIGFIAFFRVLTIQAIIYKFLAGLFLPQTAAAPYYLRFYAESRQNETFLRGFQECSGEPIGRPS